MPKRENIKLASERFRLISLSLESKEGLYFKDLPFSNREEDISPAPHTTLLVGQNGTGKSRLLSTLTQMFRELNEYKKRGGRGRYLIGSFYHLMYRYGKDVYSIKREKGHYYFTKNEAPIELNMLLLPEKVIAVASTVADKFPNHRVINVKEEDHKDDFYEYIGLRGNNNMFSSSGHLFRMIELIIEAVNKDKIRNNILEVFNYLNYSPVIEVDVSWASRLGREHAHKKLTTNDFINYFSKKKSTFSYNAYLKIFEQEVASSDDVLEKINAFYEKQLFNSNRKYISKLHYKLDFSSPSLLNDFRDDFQALNYLRRLGLVSFKNIRFLKKYGETFDSKEASSGEIQILTSLLSLVSVIEPKSLVLIDEPEVSLHPSWQMRYIDLINKVFREYNDCHFLIASHSHFMVSDLRPETSTLISLKLDENHETVIEPINYDTYGWSPENILYNVFNVGNVRNYYFEMDLRELSYLLSYEPESSNKIKSLVEKLKSFSLHDNDPVKELLSIAESTLKDD